ncbi:type IV secretory system conjugative DNA transfer family protein [Acidithiobacillus caldus]|uniref:Conjugal transfer protein TraG n=1 Tax=Acidithiobacillus caldus TaxID=33059 RepID=A0A1E7YQ95_9PROT|nr:type IV secretory system conjugative DNA transfer family protein [Acidithiobacillus caldus]OFC30223.1 conjugal transfer protein TraG [Acidithiobacillus caldus]OFC35689.1 conjugal transfer protein TraG [Acidithiobacillus caldus]OFC38451.1 conjugal transfer protein TraG [Acidithiobacillus caldus]
MASVVHRPEQNILDYRAQQRIRNAPTLGLFATAMTGFFASYLGASLGVHIAIPEIYDPNFFPGYVAKPFLGLPVFSPWELGKMAYAEWQYPMMQKATEIAGAIAAVPTLAMGIWQFVRSQRLWQSQYQTDLHGSAHWASRDEIVKMALLPDKGLHPAKGQKPSKRVCYVGGIPNERDETDYLQHAGAEHIICFAPTRSGKGVGLVLPTLLGGWQESVVVHDIKGENYLLTAGWRKSIGQKILKFNPGFGMAADPLNGMEADNNGDLGTKEQCCHFNPLEEVRVGTPFEVKDVMNIATMIVDPDGKGLNDHWQKTGFALLTSVILHVLYAEPDKTMRGVAAFLNDPELEDVDQAFDKMMDTQHRPSNPALLKQWTTLYGNATVHPAIAQSAKEMKNKAPNEKSGVISTMMSFLSLYRDPIVAEWTEYSDFHITDLQDADAPVSLYLVTSPEDKNRLKPLIRLVINLIASKFTAEDRLISKDGRMICKGKHPLLLLLDEFPSLGKMDIFQDAIAFFAGYNVKLFLITQSKSQLEDEGRGYGKSGGSVIIENCHVRIFYAPNDVTTAEWLSKMLGKKTVVLENVTQSLEGSVLPSPKGQSRSLNYQARDLLTPDEVLRLRGPIKNGSNIVKAGDMIVMVAGFAPVYGRQILYFKNPTFLERAQIPPPATSDEISARAKDYYAKLLGHDKPTSIESTKPDFDTFEESDYTDSPPAGSSAAHDSAGPAGGGPAGPADSNTPPEGGLAGGGPADGTSDPRSSAPRSGDPRSGDQGGGGGGLDTGTILEEGADEDAEDGTLDMDVSDSITDLTDIRASFIEKLPARLLEASGGADAWMQDTQRLDRRADKSELSGMLKG